LIRRSGEVGKEGKEVPIRKEEGEGIVPQ